MAEFNWPEPGERTLIGKRITRVDGPAKVSGRAKYSYDYNPAGLLFAKAVCCPYPHARIVSIDTSQAEKLPGVKAVQVIQKAGKEIFWAGDEIVGVAAVDEAAAEDAVRAVKVEYEQLPFNVSDAEPAPGAAESQGPLSMDDIGDMLDNQVPERQMVALIDQYGITFQPTEEGLQKAKQEEVPDAVIEALRKAKVHPDTGNKPHSFYQKNAEQVVGDPEQAFASAEVVSEGIYGIPVITHCCLETHGSTAEWPEKDKLLVHISTQNVSGMPGQYAEPLGIGAGNVRVHQDHIGGGFGSKFAPDRWGIAAAQLSRAAGGKPVKMMLERDHELEVAGARPSAYARVKVAARRDGTLLACNRIRGARADRGVRDRRRCRTSSISPTSESSTPPSGPTRGRRAPGALPAIPRPRSSPWARSMTWPPG
jgi:xanthine dehydrogenase YagR molybdenum-binding subunit